MQMLPRLIRQFGKLLVLLLQLKTEYVSGEQLLLLQT